MAITDDAQAIQVLRGVEPIRNRAHMYIGGTEAEGLHRMFWGAVGPAIDRHLAGTASLLAVDILDSGEVTIRDDGPGFSLELVDGKTAFETMFTTLRGWWIDPQPSTLRCDLSWSASLAVVTALSSRLEVISTCDGVTARQTYARGIATLPLATIDHVAGTMLRFHPDPEIFGAHVLDRALVATRLQEIAWLVPTLSITYQGKRIAGAGGLARWAATEGPIEASFAARGTSGEVYVEVALAWRGAGEPILRGFTNLLPTTGPHVDAIWTGLESARLLGRTIGHREVLAPGLVAIVHVGMARPRYTAQARTHQSSVESGTAVEELIAEQLTLALDTDEVLRRFTLSRTIR